MMYQKNVDSKTQSDMKANELAVGDWAFSPEMKQPITIKAILEHAQVIFAQRITNDISNRYIRNCSDIEPIPLTPEILEKNGFKYTNNHTLKGADTYVLRHEQNGFDYTITIKLNDWFAVDSFDDRMYRIFEMETGRWCVHQLQHALRLCGIEKEIVI